MIGRVSKYAVGVSAILMLSGADSRAETLMQALAAAYANNPTLNAARASLRATDEFVPQALSGWRPQVSAFADIGLNTTTARSSLFGKSRTTTMPAGVGVSVAQPIYRGNRTINSTKKAESSVLAARQSLRSTTQSVLLDAATAFMNVIRDKSILALRQQNLAFLNEQVRAARDRFEVGEGTRTDVSQAEARRALAVSQLNFAKASLLAGQAVYLQVIGHRPKRLVAKTTISRLVPNSLADSVSMGTKKHPAVLAALHAVDSAAFNVKLIEGELLPTISIEGTATRRWNTSSTTKRVDSASIVGRLSVPLYQGGMVYSRARQAKEQLGEARIKVDLTRDQVRAAVIASWGQLEASVASILAARAQVRASQLALEGVTEEQRVGQRTTLDILNQQSEVITAKINLVTAEREKVVAAFNLVAAIGRLDPSRMNLAVAEYNPTIHYNKVRDKWFGLRTPDGRK